MIDLKAELVAALKDPETRAVLRELLQDVVNEQLHHRMSDDLLDTEAAASALGITPAALRMAAYRGSVPCERIGRRLRFRRSDLTRS